MFAVLGGFGISALLGFSAAYLYIALGIGHDMNSWRAGALGVAALLTLGGFFLFVTRRMGAGITLWVLAVAALVATAFDMTTQYKMEASAHDPVHVRENEQLAAEAIARVPCTNGDVAVLSLRNDDTINRSNVSLHVIPADRTTRAHLLVSADGRYKPPSNARIWDYLEWSKATCGNDEFESLHDMMAFVTQHYETNKHKYIEKP